MMKLSSLIMPLKRLADFFIQRNYSQLLANGEINQSDISRFEEIRSNYFPLESPSHEEILRAIGSFGMLLGESNNDEERDSYSEDEINEWIIKGNHENILIELLFRPSNESITLFLCMTIEGEMLPDEVRLKIVNLFYS